MDALRRANTRTMLMATAMFGFAVAVMLNNHSYMTRRSRENERLANIDPLTGAMSKRAYLNRESELNARALAGEAPAFAVVVCDVNGLKKINDTQGHKAGDVYIRAAFDMLREIFAASPLYRVGGDEFVAILTDGDFAARRELLLAVHQRSVEHISQGGPVVSAGLSDYKPGEDQDVHTVFERADALMYEEKHLLKGLGATIREDAHERPDGGDPDPETILEVRRKVLVAEDEAVNRLMLGGMLAEKYDVLYAEDGVEVTQKLKQHGDDLALLLLDINMPRKDGIDVLREMREDPALRAIPVIVLTADQDAEVQCLQLGAMDFIPKPYPDWEIVRARVDKCVELSVNRDIIQSTERDSLTKLFNVDYFLRYVRLFDQHYRDLSMDAIALDVNRFHMVNERQGRQYGDDVLRRIGGSVRALVREIGGVGCRRGADVFLIYCPHQQDYEALLARVSEALGGDEPGGGRVRLRMGVYAEVDKALEIEQRFDRARLAAASVKSNPQSSIGIYDERMREAAVHRERLLDDFHAAIAGERFHVFLQPKFDIRHDQPLLASAEALVRWEHPELGLVSPTEFIPLLEENGLILELDRFVWRRTAALIRSWKDRFDFSVPVSVNVSRVDMLTPNLKGIFTDILEEFRLTTDDLALEITESAYAGDSEQVISVARELRGMGMGFRIEMDDFGAGYSSLGMLSRLPIDALKLDMSFIRSAFGETRDVRMIELIIDIADYLNVPVVAEGVETEEQYQTLKALGCDLVQGFYFSKPVPCEDFDRFITERARRGQVPAPAPARGKAISDALTEDFESLFYIDLSSDFYLEFHTGPDGGVQLRHGGANFFSDIREKLTQAAPPEDASQIEARLRKDALTAWMNDPNARPLAFRQREDNTTTTYTMHAIQHHPRDDHHAVIGLRKANT